MSVFVVRAFLRLRELSVSRAELATKMEELEKRVTDHDEELKAIVVELRQLIESPRRPRRVIGFSAAGAHWPTTALRSLRKDARAGSV